MTIATEKKEFDLFLCHNSKDKAVVEDIAEQLLERYSLRSWLDIWSIPAAVDWEKEIQKALSQCSYSLIFLGENGWGNFQLKEARYLYQNIENGLKIIAVRLPGAKKEDEKELPELRKSTVC